MEKLGALGSRQLSRTEKSSRIGTSTCPRFVESRSTDMCQDYQVYAEPGASQAQEQEAQGGECAKHIKSAPAPIARKRRASARRSNKLYTIEEQVFASSNFLQKFKVV